MIILRTFYSIYDEPNEVGFFYSNYYWFTTYDFITSNFKVCMGVLLTHFTWLPEYQFKDNNNPLTKEFIDEASSNI